jgi:lysophospholipase L1-like esterase
VKTGRILKFNDLHQFSFFSSYMNYFAFLGWLLFSSIKMAAQPVTISYLALGDSYTIGESVNESDRWPNQLVNALAKKGVHVSNPTLIATTGWRTDNLKDAIGKANLNTQYGLVSLLIGVNNQYQGKPVNQYAVEFEELLKMAIQLAKGKSKNVFVVSIPDYGFTPFGLTKQESITRQIDQFNEISQRISQKYHVAYYNITDISRKGLNDPTLVADDGLHPSGKMYTLWVERILEKFILP